MNIKDLTAHIAANIIHVDRLAGAFESVALAIATRAASWLATIPTVILTSRSTREIFGLTPAAALLSSISLEVVGQAIVNTWMKARDWNASRKQSDAPANETLGLAMSITYFATDFILIGVLIIPKALIAPVHLAALLFPLAQVVSTVMTAERAAQFRRETTSEISAAERQAKRKAARQARHQATFARTSSEMSNEALNARTLTDSLTLARRSRKAKLDARLDTLLTFYLDNPNAGPTEAADAIGVSRQTIYTYQDALEQAGRLKKNGSGWEII
jgi:hypothetical protein